MTMSYSIHPLQKEHVDAMYAIESIAHSHPWSKSSLADCFAPLYRILGIFDGEQLLGFAIVQQIVDEVTLHDICVKPDEMGKGLGKLLLDDVIQQAIQHHGACIFLEVRVSNLPAINLYKKAGFEQNGLRKNYYPTPSGKEDAVLMIKQLS